MYHFADAGKTNPIKPNWTAEHFSEESPGKTYLTARKRQLLSSAGKKPLLAFRFTVFFVYYTCSSFLTALGGHCISTQMVGGKMLVSQNVLKTDISAYAIRVAYNGISNSTKAADDDKAVAIIRELIYGNIAGIRQSASKANNLISMVQTLDEAATAISEKLAQMAGLAEQVIDGLYWSKGKANIQKELEALAREINDIAENTKYDGNKLFTDDGNAISVPIGNGSNAYIPSRDLRVDISGMDLTADAAGTLKSLQRIIKNVSEYTGYLGKQAERLEEAMATLELQFGKTLEIEWSDFDTTRAKKIVINAASKSLNDKSTLLDIQANVTPTAAKRLLEYKGAYLEKDTG